jgi:hypothetical protein
VPTVVLLSLAAATPAGGGCGACESSCASADAEAGPVATVCAAPRVPALRCRDALVAGGAAVELVTAVSDGDIDEVLARWDGPARPDGLRWPTSDGSLRLVIAADSDAEIRAVLRRMVRRWAPAPTKRPGDLAAARTVPDLPPIGILPLSPPGAVTLVGANTLEAARPLPATAAEVAAAVLGGATQPCDLLRHDGGSVTAHGVLLGGTGPDGVAQPWRGRVEVDDAVLSDGSDPLLACAVANGPGYATFDGLPLAPAADIADGVVNVAVAIPVVARRFGRRSIRIEVRRAQGRAVSVTPETEVPFTDDGVAGVLTRKRSWWLEPGAWSIYSGR